MISRPGFRIKAANLPKSIVRTGKIQWGFIFRLPVQFSLPERNGFVLKFQKYF